MREGEGGTDKAVLTAVNYATGMREGGTDKAVLTAVNYATGMREGETDKAVLNYRFQAMGLTTHNKMPPRSKAAHPPFYFW
jgi:hypothetical protein